MGYTLQKWNAVLPIRKTFPNSVSTMGYPNKKASVLAVRPRNHIIAMVKNMVGGGDEVDGDTPLMEPETPKPWEVVGLPAPQNGDLNHSKAVGRISWKLPEMW